MSIVLAAVDPSPVTPAVVATARALAHLAGAAVEAVHVTVDGGATDEPPLAVDGLVVRTLHGPVESSLVAALGSDEVIAGVFGARAARGGRVPTGRIALHVLQRATKPIVVVPPDGVRPPRPLQRLLVPLEGTDDTSRAVLKGLDPLLAREVELVVLHVFTPATMPRVLDRPARDLSMLSDEFVARFCPGAARVELRTGLVRTRVDEVCADGDVDLIVLSWSQDMSPGHAAVVRDVLATSTLPVLLLPTDGERPV